MGGSPTLYNLTVQTAFTVHFYRLICKLMTLYGKQAADTKVTHTFNVPQWGFLSCNAQLKSSPVTAHNDTSPVTAHNDTSPVTAHNDTFPSLNIFFSSAIKFTAYHLHLNMYFNVCHSTFWWHSITQISIHIIINTLYPCSLYQSYMKLMNHFKWRCS